MAAIIVTAATEADIPGLVQCAIGLFAEDAGTRDITIDAEWPAKHAEQSLSQAIGDPSRLVLAARQAADVIGSLSGVLEPATTMRPIRVATLLSLYVRPPPPEQRCRRDPGRALPQLGATAERIPDRSDRLHHQQDRHRLLPAHRVHALHAHPPDAGLNGGSPPNPGARFADLPIPIDG